MIFEEFKELEFRTQLVNFNSRFQTTSSRISLVFQKLSKNLQIWTLQRVLRWLTSQNIRADATCTVLTRIDVCQWPLFSVENKKIEKKTTSKVRLPYISLIQFKMILHQWESFLEPIPLLIGEANWKIYEKLRKFVFILISFVSVIGTEVFIL
jgi:hypothetical protein